MENKSTYNIYPQLTVIATSISFEWSSFNIDVGGSGEETETWFNPFTPKFKKYILPTFLKRNV